jgi:FixJ family two-component response regulator
LALSEITVKVHRAQVMRKLEIWTLPDLVRLADELRLTEVVGVDQPKV